MGLAVEDFAVGQVYPLGGVTVSAEEVVAGATHWDPQPFHVDLIAAQGPRRVRGAGRDAGNQEGR